MTREHQQHMQAAADRLATRMGDLYATLPAEASQWSR